MKTMNKVLMGHKYVANFLDAPVRIGMIYRMDDDQFIPAIHFNDDHPAVSLQPLTDSGTKGSIKFSESKDVTISFGGSASTGIGKSEVKLSFKKKRSVAGVISDAVIDSVRFGKVLPQLKATWTDRGYIKYLKDYIFVYQVVNAASGTLIYSEDSKNEVVLKHTLNEAVGKLGDLGSGNFEYVSNTKRTLELIRNVAHKPLFKAFAFRKDWEPEHLG
jgi:hypothetical protein